MAPWNEAGCMEPWNEAGCMEPWNEAGCMEPWNEATYPLILHHSHTHMQECHHCLLVHLPGPGHLTQCWRGTDSYVSLLRILHLHGHDVHSDRHLCIHQ